MYKYFTLQDLPVKITWNNSNILDQCWIYRKGSTPSIPKEPALSTDRLQPSELIHIDFLFMSAVFIRGFSAILVIVVIVNAKTRKLWRVSTPDKRHSLNILHLFLSLI